MLAEAGDAQFVMAVLGPGHDVSRFDSGEPETDGWLGRNSMRSQRQGSARTWVLLRRGELEVLGYYCITPHEVRREELPGAVAGGLSVVPGYLVAQLAVSHQLQGRGLGAALLRDALERIVAASASVGGRPVVVDAVDEAALTFYERFGFIRIGTSLRLYLKVSRVAATLAPRSGEQPPARFP